LKNATKKKKVVRQEDEDAADQPEKSSDED
jgi:hypothetical protein